MQPEKSCHWSLLREKGTECEGNRSSFAACYVLGAFLFNSYHNPGTEDCCSFKKVDERSDMS
jgi:hypothetical protein